MWRILEEEGRRKIKGTLKYFLVTFGQLDRCGNAGRVVLAKMVLNRYRMLCCALHE